MPASLYPELDEARRFWSRVEKRGSCWIWTGATNKRANGYGHFGINGKTVYAHRWAYILAHGSIPDGLHVCHTCDTPTCVNPEHLFAATHAENMADCTRKERWPVGEKSTLARLTESQVRAIYNASGTQLEIARRFGINRSTVSRIKNGKRWAYLRLTS